MTFICRDIVKFLNQNNFKISSWSKNFDTNEINYLYFKNVNINKKNIKIWLNFSMINRCGAILSYSIDEDIEINIDGICFSNLDKKLNKLINYIENER